MTTKQIEFIDEVKEILIRQKLNEMIESINDTRRLVHLSEGIPFIEQRAKRLKERSLEKEPRFPTSVGIKFDKKTETYSTFWNEPALYDPFLSYFAHLYIRNEELLPFKDKPTALIWLSAFVGAVSDLGYDVTTADIKHHELDENMGSGIRHFMEHRMKTLILEGKK